MAIVKALKVEGLLNHERNKFDGGDIFRVLLKKTSEMLADKDGNVYCFWSNRAEEDGVFAELQKFVPDFKKEICEWNTRQEKNLWQKFEYVYDVLKTCRKFNTIYGAAGHRQSITPYIVWFADNPDSSRLPYDILGENVFNRDLVESRAREAALEGYGKFGWVSKADYIRDRELDKDFEFVHNYW